MVDILSSSHSPKPRCRSSLSPVVVAFIGLLVFAPTAPGAEPDSASTVASFLSRHQIGVRLGAWVNLGDDPVKRDTAAHFETNFHDGSFYFEGYYAHRFTRFLMGEFSLGIANRGSVTFQEEGSDNVGNLIVYSILLHGKFYPLTATGWAVQPYLSAGGGFYYGRRSVQFTSSYDYYYTGLDEETRTDFGYAVGGGLDWPISPVIGLDFMVRYSPVTFGDPLMTIEDYSALAITIGVKYLYFGPSKESDPDRRMR